MPSTINVVLTASERFTGSSVRRSGSTQDAAPLSKAAPHVVHERGQGDAENNDRNGHGIRLRYGRLEISPGHDGAQRAHQGQEKAQPAHRHVSQTEIVEKERDGTAHEADK